jgi:hypothetical protein
VICLICRRPGRINSMGEVRDEGFTVSFDTTVCQSCADRIHGVLEETITMMTAGEGMTTQERIDRFIARLRTNRPAAGDGTPGRSVDELLRSMGLNPGDAL